MKITLVGQMLTAALVLHQLFVIVLLVTRNEERKDHSYAMAVFFAANLTTNLPDMIGFFRPGLHVEFIEMFSTSFLMLLGPATYFYARALVAPEVIRLERKDFRHVIPFLAVLIAMIAIVPIVGGLTIMSGAPVVGPGSPGEEVLSRLAQPQATNANLPLTPAIIAMIAISVSTVLAFIVLTTSYILRTLRLLARYRRSKYDYFAAIEGRSLTWFECFIGLLAFVWLVNMAIILDDMTVAWLKLSPDMSSVIEAVWVYALSFMVLWQQAIFKPYRQGPVTGMPEAIAGEEPSANGGKYQRSALDGERGRRIATKIEKAMAEERLYRNQGMTLRHLSDHTRVPENYLSQVLNETLGRNFYEFVNHWRIRDACALLAEDALSIIEIGEEVGFNSRSTFNAAFKKETGLTPSEYRANLRRVA
ncbi:MAG: helix-turn-helix transcriptional regulator [Proteobacteria bacterium]|nr:helix-turn-helix transcriptional regulator [Pseudomonadota bacterium]